MSSSPPPAKRRRRTKKQHYVPPSPEWSIVIDSSTGDIISKSITAVQLPLLDPQNRTIPTQERIPRTV